MADTEEIDGISHVRSYLVFSDDRIAYRPATQDSSVGTVRQIYEILDDLADDHCNDYCTICGAYFDVHGNEIAKDEYWKEEDV